VTAPRGGQNGMVFVAVAGGLVDAVGVLAAARSVADAARAPRRVRLFLVTDAEDDARLARFRAAADCALADAGLASYAVAAITPQFLRRHGGAAFRSLFAQQELNRTRPNLVKASANYARVYLPELFPELTGQLVIYLDGDVLVNADVATLAAEARAILSTPLVTHHLSHHHQRKRGHAPTPRGGQHAAPQQQQLPAVAAVLKALAHPEYAAAWRRRYPDDPRDVACFNAGVMVIDLERWAAQQMTQRVESWIERNPIGGSQLPVNLAVASNFAPLRATWNCPIRTGELDELISVGGGAACLHDPGVRHWTGRAKPWVRNGRLQFFWYPKAHKLRPCLIAFLEDASAPTEAGYPGPLT